MQKYLNKKDVIFDTLRQKIVSKEYKSGYKFPTEPVMAKELGVGRITLRAALEALERSGLIVRFPGKGTFVCSEEERLNLEKKVLILHDIYSQSFEAPSRYIVPAFESCCERLNIKTVSMDINFLLAGEKDDVVERLRKSNYYGVLLNGSYYKGDEKEISILRELNIPVVIPHGKAEDYNTTGFAVIHPDNRKAWSEGIEYLFRKGHLRFATLGITFADGKKNLRGFSESKYFSFLDELGADSDPELLKYVEYDYKSVYAAVKKLMALENPPTAIMCFSDFIAIEVYKSLNKLGYKIPNEVAVMGYCGYPGDHLMSPSLSTVDLQYNLIGELAAKMLYRADQWFNKPDVAVPRIVSPHKLRTRGSVDIVRVEKQLVNV